MCLFVFILVLKEISSLSVEPCEGESLVVTVFKIQKSEVFILFFTIYIPSLIKRKSDSIENHPHPVVIFLISMKPDTVFHSKGA